MKLFRLFSLVAALAICSCTLNAENQEIIIGAQCTDEYIPLLEGKRVALFSNHTGIVPSSDWTARHTLDILLESDIDVVTIFSPEHGFRGDADAGETVGSSTDAKTGVRITSLYGGGFNYSDPKNFEGIDVIVSDIQDVGLRFYTYYVTMAKLMESAARFGKIFMILDRPNPNSMYVDGPVLDMEYRSGVGRFPIPVVYGMTLGELALMANGEGWLDDGLKLAELKVIGCRNYTHQSRYQLPVAPSPNLKSMHAVYLYPSTCYFEATPVSLGRGTQWPFEIYGHPDYSGGDTFSFTPESLPGAKNPPQLGHLCYGRDLRDIPDEQIISRGIDLSYLIDAYRHIEDKDNFFSPFFEKLIGRGDIRAMIESGMSADDIKASWAQDVEAFKIRREKYLIYE